MSLQDPRSHNQEGHPHSCSTPESLGTSDSTHNALWQSPTQEVTLSRASTWAAPIVPPTLPWHSRLTLDTFFYKHVSVKLCQLVPVGGEGGGWVVQGATCSETTRWGRQEVEGSGLESCLGPGKGDSSSRDVPRRHRQ